MFQSSTISFESKSCNVDAAPEHIWKCEKTVASKYNRHPLYQFFFGLRSTFLKIPTIIATFLVRQQIHTEAIHFQKSMHLSIFAFHMV